ncbi:MAG: hypothetical protein CML23_01040 [Rhizobiaceae bacterium]|nr:hypothetical protein [Rhizobiaceae bacterium]
MRIHERRFDPGNHLADTFFGTYHCCVEPAVLAATEPQFVACNVAAMDQSIDAIPLLQVFLDINRAEC